MYVKDYIADTRCLSMEARGAWSDALMFMWVAEPRGELSYSVAGFARLWACPQEQAEGVILEFIDNQICDVLVTNGASLSRHVSVTRDILVTLSDKKVTLRNRRMFREAQAKSSHADRQFKYRQKKSQKPSDGESDAKVTPPSSCSSSSSAASAYDAVVTQSPPVTLKSVLPSPTQDAKKPAPAPRPRNELSDLFEERYFAVYAIAYQRKQADFVQLAKLRKREGFSETDWPKAVDSYLATEQSSHTLADCAGRFEVFRSGPLDRYGKPINSKSNGGSNNGTNQRIVGYAAPIPGKYANRTKG